MTEFRSQMEVAWRVRSAEVGVRLMATRASSSARPDPGPHQQLRRELFERLLRSLESRGTRGLQSTEAVRQRVRDVLDEVFSGYDVPPISPRERRQIELELVAEANGYGPLAAVLEDATVSDVLVNGPDEVFVDRYGRLERVAARFDDASHLLHFVSRLVAAQDRHIDAASPYVDVRLQDGSRLHAVVPPLTKSPIICIRRSRTVPFTADQLCHVGTLDEHLWDALSRAVSSGANIVISGGVGSGKTTLLNVLASAIPRDARVVTIEETAELRLAHPHVVALEARLPNNEGRGEVTLRTLVRNALRMRADRLIVGEVRGAEVFDMLQAMNTGHSGSLTTVHANSAHDALRRLESLVMLAGFPLPGNAVRELIANTVHMVVHMHRGDDGRRRVVEVGEIDAASGEMLTTYRYDEIAAQFRCVALGPDRGEA